MVHVIGTCGNCGGQVTIPEPWFGIYPPTPHCRSCGSTPKEAHGKVLDMDPPPQKRGYGPTVDDKPRSKVIIGLEEALDHARKYGRPHKR